MKILTQPKSPTTYHLPPTTSRSADPSLSEEFYEYFNVDKKESKEQTEAIQ